MISALKSTPGVPVLLPAPHVRTVEPIPRSCLKQKNTQEFDISPCHSPMSFHCHEVTRLLFALFLFSWHALQVKRIIQYLEIS